LRYAKMSPWEKPPVTICSAEQTSWTTGWNAEVVEVRPYVVLIALYVRSYDRDVAISTAGFPDQIENLPGDEEDFGSGIWRRDGSYAAGGVNLGRFELEYTPLDVGKRTAGSESGSLFEDDRPGKLELVASHHLDKAGIRPLGGAEQADPVGPRHAGICPIDFGRVQTHCDLRVGDHLEKLGKNRKFGSGETREAIDPKFRAFDKTGLRNRPAGPGQLKLGIDELAFNELQIFSENQADIGKFQSSQAITVVFVQFAQKLLDVVRCFGILMQFGHSMRHLSGQARPCR